ncbi:hypothetical protein Cni_G07134 [Canna indica]|uniref:Secreted protein n=1 Tax=Canna indica TaxID=4628 RepID=A0AAQ3Q733_9LILI|nr:hypothetical protein Cni_G07134 [Canna indica]
MRVLWVSSLLCFFTEASAEAAGAAALLLTENTCGVAALLLTENADCTSPHRERSGTTALLTKNAGGTALLLNEITGGAAALGGKCVCVCERERPVQDDGQETRPVRGDEFDRLHLFFVAEQIVRDGKGMR